MEERVAMYLMKRVAILAVVLVLGATFVFSVFFVLPEDPVWYFVPKGSNEETRQHLIEEWKLDEPIPVQYVNFMTKMFTGDFPASMTYRPGADVEDFVYPGVSATLELYFLVALIGCLLGAFIEQAMSRIKHPKLRAASHGLALLMVAVPVGGLSLFLLMLVAKYDLPFPMTDGTLMPVLVGVIATCGGYILIARQPSQNQAGGLREIVVGAASRAMNLLSMPDRRAALFALSAWTMAIVLVTEVLFWRNGLGQLFITSLYYKDIPLGMSVAFAVITFMIVIQFAADVGATLLLRRARPGMQQSERRIDAPPTTAFDHAPPTDGARTVEHPSGLFRQVLNGLIRSWRGRIAIGLLLMMVVLGAGAPIFSTVGNPLEAAHTEPERRTYDYDTGVYIQEWENPHAPMFDRSPFTGYMHPLGTDQWGRDIYSLLVYGLRDELAVAAFVASIALLMGLASTIVGYALRGKPDALRLLFRGGASALSWTLIAIPLPLGLTLVMMVVGMEFWTAQNVVLVTVWAWAVHSLFLLGRFIRPRNSEDMTNLGLTDDLRANTDRILHVGKQVFLVAYLSFAVAALIGKANPDQIYWGSMLEGAWIEGGFFLEAWWWIVPPMFATTLLCAAIYVIIDTMEKAAAASRKEDSKEG